MLLFRLLAVFLFYSVIAIVVVVVVVVVDIVVVVFSFLELHLHFRIVSVPLQEPQLRIDFLFTLLTITPTHISWRFERETQCF